MEPIRLLDEATVNKIAAGEVIERPLSIVKELVENAVDAGASALTIEIRGGGIDFVRVTDNGAGIAGDQVKDAFLSHATSKIRKAEDLFAVRSLGFRGEALSSIAAVCQVEIVTKTGDALTGVRYRIDGGAELSFEEVGAPDGTTFIARNLFFHTPARRKFLKTPATEAGYITEFVQMMAIHYSDISFKYIVNNQTRLVTTGNGDRKENIYKVYGREIAENILEAEADGLGMRARIYAAKPVVARSSREYEIFFVNGHYIKDRILEKSLEEAYKPYLMQHRFPFAMLVLTIDPGLLDVNVHPRKTEMKFVEGAALFEFVRSNVEALLKNTELINRAELTERAEEHYVPPRDTPEPFEEKRRESSEVREESSETLFEKQTAPPVLNLSPPEVSEDPEPYGKQLDLFAEKIIQPANKPCFRLVGQVFGTYWILEYQNRMLMVDQHAAHEKVLYERFVKQYREKSVVSQYVNPPLIITVNGRQEQTITRYAEAFASLGFELEHFEGNDYIIRAVPSGFMQLEQKEIFLSLLDELEEGMKTEDVSLIRDRLAQMSCKAAVKGNTPLSALEADHLFSELLGLENPYNCPHGRPTMIEFTERELEKKFKRIV